MTQAARPKKRLLLSIGRVAEKTGETVRAIRYWTEEGLLQISTRTSGKHFRYTTDVIARIKEIRHLQKAKRLTIAELKEYYVSK